jgi:hypothetical protein
MMPISAVGGAGEAGHEDRAEHRAQLADERQRHRRAQVGLRPEAREGQEDLQPEDHAGEGAGEHHDGQRPEADEVDPVDQAAELEGRDDGVRGGLEEEPAELPEPLDHLEAQTPQRGDGPQRRRPNIGSWGRKHR